MAKSEPSDKCPSWTSARYWQFIRSALRAAWSKYPVKYQVLQSSRRTVVGQRHKFEYQCVECKEWFQQKDVQVDHIHAAGSLRDYKDLPRFVENLFCGADNLQILCKADHKVKTLEERRLNKENEDE